MGLLGPNGAGKTTSFYMIVGLIRSGERWRILAGYTKTSPMSPMYLRARNFGMSSSAAGGLGSFAS